MAVNATQVYAQCYNLTSAGSIQFTGGTTYLSVPGGTASYDPPAILSVTAPAGGSGTIEYMWIYSLDGVNFAAISGATTNTYNPPVINQTTWYRRCARRSGCTSWVGESNNVQVEFLPCPPCSNVTSAGVIGNPQSNCGAFNPGLITSTSLPSGGSTAALEYVWLSTTDPSTPAGTTWNVTTIASNTSTYDPPANITQTTWYRRCSRRAGCTSYVGESNWVMMEVLKVPTVTATGGSVCDGGTISLNANATLTGGSIASYAWTGPNNFTSTAQSPVLTGVTSTNVGTYTVTVTGSNGCTATATATLSLNTNCGTVCATRVVTSNAYCGTGTQYAMWTNNFITGISGVSQYYTITSGSFQEYSNGTAVFTGLVTNTGNTTVKFNINVTYSGRTCAAPSGSPKTSHCSYTINPTDWYYYPSMTGTLTGTNAVAGAVINLTQMGPSFQIGTGANLNEQNLFGGSGWLNLNIVSQPTRWLLFGKFFWRL